MANHPSAIKRHKQSLKKASKNRTIKTRIKNVVKAVRLAIQGKNKEEALLALNTAKTVIDKAGWQKNLALEKCRTQGFSLKQSCFSFRSVVFKY